MFDGYKHKVGREEGHCYMTVTNVGPDDCGEIECRAFNKEGNATIRAKLILQCKFLLLPISVSKLKFVQLSNRFGVLKC